MSIPVNIQAAMASARIKPLEDKTYFGEIPGFPGVWANEKTAKKCRKVLREVLEDWIMLDKPLLRRLRAGELDAKHRRGRMVG